MTADTGRFLTVAGEFLRAEVVLYTDLANPTSNALYQGLGYRPVEDRAVLSFTPARHGLRFTRERTRGLRPAGRR